MSNAVLKPHVPAAGYALFLVIFATQTWGGVFPFLPADFQTDTVTLLFYLSQSLAFCGAFVASAFGSYFFPLAARHMLVKLSTALTFLGAACVIAAMYAPAWTQALVLGGGAFLGVGCAGLFMLWQRYFSSLEAQACNSRLIAGTILASAAYFALYLIPIALTAFLLPVVVLPVCALCLSLAVRQMDFNQPMFEDVPRQNPQVYAKLLQDSWREALCVGALAFAAGLARGVAVLNPAISGVVNASSMLGMLAAAVILLLLWMRASVRFSLQSVFRMAYPAIITGLLLFPFVKNVGLGLFVSLTYGLFSLVVLIMMMQCAQIARERGTNPVFAYAFFGSMAYVPQSIGFLLGWFAFDIEILGVGQVTLLSLVAAYVLGMALFVSSRARSRADQVVLTSMAFRHKAKGTDGQTSPVSAGPKDKKPSRKKKEFAEGRVIADRLSKQCLALQERYGLSERETEVAELIARGRTVAAIAQELFVSENTVRTHSKHIYTKLNIHSKAELSALVQSMNV